MEKLGMHRSQSQSLGDSERANHYLLVLKEFQLNLVSPCKLSNIPFACFAWVQVLRVHVKNKSARTWGWNLCHWPFLQWRGSHFKQTSCYQDCSVIHPVSAVSSCQTLNSHRPGVAIQAVLWHRVQAIATHGFERKLSVLNFCGNFRPWPWPGQCSLSFRLLMGWMDVEHCCAQINGQFLLAPLQRYLL